MADARTITTLTGLDRFMVRTYRAGLVAMTCGLAILAGECALFGPRIGAGVALVALGCQLSIWTLHIYDAGFRRIFQNLGLLAAVCVLGGLATRVELLVWAGLGWSFASFGGLGLKERTCFQVRGSRLLPSVLALSMVPLVLGDGMSASLLLSLAAVLGGFLVEVKLAQPLHLDIGDRALYR